MDEIEYFANEDWDETFDGVVAALNKQNEGRNKDCFPLASFGWKGADLDPEGCTGIKSICNITDESISFIIGGHKTFCPFEFDEDQERYREQIEEQEQIVIGDIGYPGDWTGDDWDIRMYDKEVTSQVFFDEESGEVDYAATASHMILKAKVELADYQIAMCEASEDFEKIHNQLRRD